MSKTFMSEAIPIKHELCKRHKGWPLVKQVLISISLVLVVLAFAANAVIGKIEAKYLNQLLKAESERTTTLVAQAALEGMVAEDIPHLQTIAEQVGENSISIITVSIFSYDHKRLAHWRSPEKLDSDDYVEWKKHVYLENEEFGYIKILWRTDRINHQVELHVSYLSYLVFAVVGILGIVSFLLIHRLVILPIQLINHDLNRLQDNENVIIGNDHVSRYGAIELLNLSDSVSELSVLWNQNRERERRLELEVEKRKLAEQKLLNHRNDLQNQVDEKTRELREAMEYANKANQSKSIFLANMSHELRTPMHAILSFSRFGIQKYENLPPQKIKKYFDNIHESASRLLLLLNDLLDLAKLEAGKMELDIMLNDICVVAKNCVVELEASMEEKQLFIEWQCSTDHVLGQFDRMRIAQVVVNFLSNAIKFTPQGKKIYLMVQASNGVIQLEVHDEGAGIPDGEYHLVFERFVQSSQNHQKVKGTGLGLSICKEIIEKHGGEIWAEPSEKGGAAFKFKIPQSSTR